MYISHCFNVLRDKDTTFLAHLFKMCAIFKDLASNVYVVLSKTFTFANGAFLSKMNGVYPFQTH